MAATGLDSLYEQVRKTGLPYQIKESGGAIVIKISSDRKYQFNQSQEKFRFHTNRTFNGSSNKNWRLPQNFSEHSFHKRPSFPDLTFFQSTPPPKRLIPTPPKSPPPKRPIPPPPTSAVTNVPGSSESTSVSETSPALRSTFQIRQGSLQQTPFNPYRSMKRQVIFPSTPNLFTPSPVQGQGLKVASSDSSISSTNSPTPTQTRPASKTTFSTEDMDALKTFMKHLHEKTKF